MKLSKELQVAMYYYLCYKCVIHGDTYSAHRRKYVSGMFRLMDPIRCTQQWRTFWRKYRNMIDPILICVYCGDVMDAPTEKQIEIFGEPECCEQRMLQIERNNLHKVHKGIEKLKANIEHELVKDQL